MASLETLWLPECNWSGAIPAALGQTNNLRILNLDGNQLSGAIPEELGNVSSLEFLYLSDNQLTGSIPVELSNLSNLKLLDMQENALSGSIPSVLGNLTQVSMVNLSSNDLSGPIPGELGDLSALTTLRLSGNNLTGPIPSQIANLTQLRFLNASQNDLSGAIPSFLGSLSNLEELSLWGNQLTGELPASLGNLLVLENLTLHQNQLGGEIPSELCNLTASLSLYENQFCPEYPACLANDVGVQDTSSCPADDPCDGVTACPVNSTCTPDTGLSNTAGGPGYACECDAGYQDNDNNDTCLPDCDSVNCLNAIFCEDSSGVAECISDDMSCDQIPSSTSGAYYIDPDGVYWGEPAFLTYCDMVTDGGGWTAFFAGYNGRANTFASFEGNAVACQSESSQCLRRIPDSYNTSTWFAASCGEKMIKFQISNPTLDLFNSGTPNYWEDLYGVTAIKGSLTYLPDRIWTGDPSGAQGNSWVLTRSVAAAADRHKTFSSSYSLSSVWDYCDGVVDNSSPIYLFYR